MTTIFIDGESGTTGGIPDDIVEKVFPVLEIASPYAYSDLWDNEEQCCKIQTIQHSDILYIFNEDFPLMVLKRYSNTTWVLEELEIRNGPFLSMNTTDISIATDELEGEVQLTLITTRILECMTELQFAQACAFSVVLILLVFTASGLMALITRTLCRTGDNIGAR